MSGMILSSMTQSFPPHTLWQVMPVHHIVTDQSEQGTIEVIEKLLPIRPKEEACAKSVEAMTTYLDPFPP